MEGAGGGSMTSRRTPRMMAELEEEPGIVYYNVKASIRQIETWKDVKRGYMSLTWYICFVLTFVGILAMQLDIGRAYLIDYSLREVLVGQSEKLDGIRSINQLWDYIIGTDPATDTGLVGKIFEENWYNGQTYDPNELGFVLEYNKIVGGVLLVQQRGMISNCTEESVYSILYPDCYSWTVDQTPFGPLGADGLPAYNYSSQWGGHGVFLKLSDGRDVNVALVNDLKANLWIDKQTRVLHTKFAVYNGNLELFTYMDLKFTFGQGGGLKRPHSLKIQSVSLELYNRPIDIFRLTLEMVFIAIVGFQFGTEVNELLECVAKGRPLEYFLDFWNILDILNIALFSVGIIWRVQYVYLVSANPLEVPTDEYKLLIEQAAQLQGTQVSINSFNILICIFRLFKFYEFQDRLNILTRTFGHAWTDLYHFLIMFLVIFFGYSFLSHVIWGPHLYAYNTFGLAIQTQWEMILGNYDYQSMKKIAPDFAAILFWSFIFFVAIVCLNVLLAILIEAFGTASEPEDQDIPPNSVGEQLTVAAYRLLSKGPRDPSEKDLTDPMLARVLRHFAADGIKIVTESDIAARLDYGMQSQLQRKLPILKVADSAMVEREKGIADSVHLEMNRKKQELLRRSTALLHENTRLKEKIIQLEQLSKPTNEQGI